MAGGPPDGARRSILTVNGGSSSKWIGAFAAALEGLDALVFAGGIGENAPQVRARICRPLAFLGIELEAQRNVANAPVISADRSRVAVRVRPTDEEVMIARSVHRIIQSIA